MNELDLDAIEARAEAATPGPWVAGPPYESGRRWIYAGDRCVGGITTTDGEFIAHARTDIPALIAEVERLRGVRQEVETPGVWVSLGVLMEMFAAWDRYGGPSHTAACKDWTDDACYCGAFRLQKALRSLRKATP